MTVDTAALRELGEHLVDEPRELVFSAADEIDELTAKLEVVELARDAYRDSFDVGRRAHAETKRELEKMRQHVTRLVEIFDSVNVCNDQCGLAAIFAWVDPQDRARVKELRDKLRARLESAEAALREYTGPDTRNTCIAERHFARFGGQHE